MIELEGMIEHEAHDKPGIPAFWAALALARAEAGAWREHARRWRCTPPTASPPSRTTRTGWSGCASTRTCGHVGDRVGAAALEPLLAPWTGQVAFNSATVWGFVARHAGVLDRVPGRHDRAVERLEQAESSTSGSTRPLARARAAGPRPGAARPGRSRRRHRAGRLLERALEEASATAADHCRARRGTARPGGRKRAVSAWERACRSSRSGRVGSLRPGTWRAVPNGDKQKVVILGGGCGGVTAAFELTATRSCRTAST